MMLKASANTSGGVGFLGLLALLFIGLKLGGVIGWSWWWVLAPLWGPAVVAILVMIFALLMWLVSRQRRKKSGRRGMVGRRL